MYERYAGLIFDTDSTVLDTEPTHRKTWREVLGHHGLRYNVQAMIALNGSPTWRIARIIIELNQVDLDPYALAREGAETVRSILLNSAELLPLIEVVKSRHGRRLMVVGTGNESAIAETLLIHLGSCRYLDAVIAANHVKRHKPTPDTFLLYTQRMGVQPTQYVVSEDADFGTQAAYTAGMDTVDVRLL